MKRHQVTPEMLRMMNPEVAAEYGYLDRVLPKESPGEATIPKLERDEHGDFENWLNLHGYAYRHSRTDKPTRETCGAPDFTVYRKRPDAPDKLAIGQCLAIEFKLPGNKLSKAQQKWADKYGAFVWVLANSDAAIQLVKRAFGD